VLPTALVRPVAVSLTLVAVVGSAAPGAARSFGGDSTAASSRPATGALDEVSRRFEVNLGQVSPEVRFLSRGPGYTLFLTATEAVAVLHARPKSASRDDTGQTRPSVASVLRMRLAGANPSARVSGHGRLPGVSNYFLGSDPARWRTGVPSYARVVYDDVYPGIDLVWHGRDALVEYDFVVAPGADPGEVWLEFAGAESLFIDGTGDLVARTHTSEMRYQAPRIYQEIGGTRRPVRGGYVLDGTNRIRFRVARYLRELPLVIDPVLAYSTYLPAVSADLGLAVALDAAGSAYVTGSTPLDDFPTTPGAYQPTRAGSLDAFVTKLAPDGSSLAYSTYLGGAGGGYGSDRGFAVAVDSSGSAYVTGSTISDDFPTTPGAHQPTRAGSVDAFVTKLAPDGSSLAYSTYLGGAGGGFGADEGRGIAVDASGSAYVTGDTNSSDFPTTVSAFQTAYAGARDAFVTKLAPDGSSLAYSTYLGGAGGGYGTDRGFAVAVDAAGSAFVTGYTTASDFPTTPGAIQTAYAGSGDAFVTKLAPDGSSLAYSTYLGGSAYAPYSASSPDPSGPEPLYHEGIASQDVGRGIAVDAFGSAYLSGSTVASDFPATPGAFQTIYGGCGDAFVTKLAPNGSSLAYSTYLGGSGTCGTGALNEGRAVAVDAQGSAYVTGYTLSDNFPTTDDAIQTYRAGYRDAFVTKLAPNGSELSYSTYLGGGSAFAGSDEGHGIAVDAAGSAYVAGMAGSDDFPTTEGAFQPEGAGGGFVAKLADQDPGGLVVVEEGGATRVSEGGAGDSYAVSLDSPPAATVTVDVSPDAQLSVSPSTLVFGPASWSSPQTVLVTAVDDSVREPSPRFAFIRHETRSTDVRYARIKTSVVTVEVTDDDLEGVTVQETDGSTVVREGGAQDTYTLALESQPTANVTITVSPDPQVSAVPLTLEFTPADWSIPQTVAVAAVDDDAEEPSPRQAGIGHAASSADPEYEGLAVPVVTVTVIDDDGRDTGPSQAVAVDARSHTGGWSRPLAAGQRYVMEVSEPYQYGFPFAPYHLADAECSTDPQLQWSPDWYGFGGGGNIDLNDWLDLYVDGPVTWVPVPGTERPGVPACSITHRYRVEFVGTGASANFFVWDPYGVEDNVGVLVVEITPVP
jgi:hypothetical protein